MADYQTNRDVDGKIGSITSSDGTRITPIRDVMGETQGYKVDRPLKNDDSSSISDPDGELFKFGCEVIENSCLGQLFMSVLEIHLKIIRIAFIIAGACLLTALVLLVIERVAGIEVFDHIREFLIQQNLLKISKSCYLQTMINS